MLPESIVLPTLDLGGIPRTFVAWMPWGLPETAAFLIAAEGQMGRGGGECEPLKLDLGCILQPPVDGRRGKAASTDGRAHRPSLPP